MGRMGLMGEGVKDPARWSHKAHMSHRAHNSHLLACAYSSTTRSSLAPLSPPGGISVVIHKSSALFLALFGYNFVGLIRGYEHHLASNRLVLDRKITEGISAEDL